MKKQEEKPIAKKVKVEKPPVLLTDFSPVFEILNRKRRDPTVDFIIETNTWATSKGELIPAQCLVKLEKLAETIDDKSFSFLINLKGNEFADLVAFMVNPSYPLNNPFPSLRIADFWDYKSFKVSGKRVCNISLQFEFTEEMQKQLKYSFGDIVRINQESFTNTRRLPYGHPFLRTCVDILTSQALADISAPFVDVGSKYHKIQRIVPWDFIAYRGPFAPYDIIYLRKY